MLRIVTLLSVAAAVWSARRKVEMDAHTEWHLRYKVQYALARKGMTWQMAEDIAAKVPRAWL